jgi:NADPH:quinone reductase-like Zn-dependent oxidoreductase
MRAIVLDGGFGLENLRMIDRPVPEPGIGQVRVKIKAVSLNYRDLLLVQGKYNPRQTFPVIPASDCAGVVDAVGPGVDTWSPGDRVVNQFIENWMAGPVVPGALSESRGGPGGDGVLCDSACFDGKSLLPIPQYLSFVEAATLPCAGLTGWSAIYKSGVMRPGASVVVQGTGGVAVFAIQFAKLAGARVAVVSSSDEKLAAIAGLRPDFTLNYSQTPDWGKAIRSDFAGAGADVIIEVGGEKTLQQSLRAVRGGGTVCLIGVLSGAIAPLNLPLVVMRHVRLQGITVGSHQDMVEMMAAMSVHELRPVIGRQLDFDAFIEGFEALKSGRHVGKIVLTLDGPSSG